MVVEECRAHVGGQIFEVKNICERKDRIEGSNVFRSFSPIKDRIESRVESFDKFLVNKRRFYWSQNCNALKLVRNDREWKRKEIVEDT